MFYDHWCLKEPFTDPMNKPRMSILFGIWQQPRSWRSTGCKVWKNYKELPPCGGNVYSDREGTRASHTLTLRVTQPGSDAASYDTLSGRSCRVSWSLETPEPAEEEMLSHSFSDCISMVSPSHALADMNPVMEAVRSWRIGGELQMIRWSPKPQGSYGEPLDVSGR